jgi:uncharacterized membrane protein YqiK
MNANGTTDTTKVNLPPLPNTSQRRSMIAALSGAGRQFWGRLIVAVLFLLPLIAVFAGQLLYTAMTELQALQVSDPNITEHLVHELRSVGFLFLSVIILLCILGIYFIFFLSVRVYGPQVALVRFIDQLKAGNYSPYRSLRRDDQLKEIWKGLQDLAADLKRKHG